MNVPSSRLKSKLVTLLKTLPVDLLHEWHPFKKLIKPLMLGIICVKIAIMSAAVASGKHSSCCGASETSLI